MSFLKSLSKMVNNASHFVEKKVEHTVKHVADDVKKAEKVVHQAVHQVEKKVEHAAKQVVKDTVHISKKAQEAFHHAEKKAEQVVKHVAHDVKKAEKVVHQAVHQVEKKVEHAAKQAVKDTVHISKKAQEAFHHAEKKAEQVVKHVAHDVKKAEKAVHQAIHQVEKKVEQAVKHPEKTIDHAVHQVEKKAEHISKQAVHGIIKAEQNVERTVHQVGKNVEKSLHKFSDSAVEFAKGAGDAALADVTFGLVQRHYDSNHPVAYRAGQMVGNAVYTIAGVVETIGAGALEIGGAVLTATGEGAPIGVPVMAAAGEGIAHGAAETSLGITRFAKSAKELYKQLSRSEDIRTEGRIVSVESELKSGRVVSKSNPKPTRKPNEPKEFKERVINEDGTKTYTLVSKKNGKEYKVTYDRDGYPIFNSKHDAKLPESLYLKSDSKQFKYLTKELAKEIENNPELAKKFTKEELELINRGKVPNSLTWHHHQEPGKMQLVDYYEHEVAKHTGGRSIWGGGREGRTGKLK